MTAPVPARKPVSTLKLVAAIGAAAVLIVGGFVVYGLLGYSRFQDARIDDARNHATQLRAAADRYVVQKRRCPSSADDLRSALLVSRAPIDPWGGAYVLACDDARRITVTSPGPDGALGTTDDVNSGT